ncbi:hypothetical protein DSC45_14755 [Streptomyces sp. YIM 130001]|nr:hypothetical protein DSC45_14755 [Streptomyces sp. YIM 130001]
MNVHAAGRRPCRTSRALRSAGGVAGAHRVTVPRRRLDEVPAVVEHFNGGGRHMMHARPGTADLRRFAVRRSAFGVRRSAFGVRRSAFGVRRSASRLTPPRCTSRLQCCAARSSALPRPDATRADQPRPDDVAPPWAEDADRPGQRRRPDHRRAPPRPAPPPTDPHLERRGAAGPLSTAEQLSPAGPIPRRPKRQLLSGRTTPIPNCWRRPAEPADTARPAHRAGAAPRHSPRPRRPARRGSRPVPSPSQD